MKMQVAAVGTHHGGVGRGRDCGGHRDRGPGEDVVFARLGHRVQRGTALFYRRIHGGIFELV